MQIVQDILCKFVLFVAKVAHPVKHSKQSKFDTWCISNLDHPQNHVFFVQIMYQPGHVFLKQGRIMLLKSG